MEETEGFQLTRFLHELAPRDIPDDARVMAKACILDAFGCAFFGSTQPWSQILAAELASDGGDGAATVIGRALRLPVTAAAICNGTAIHGFELDDLIAESIIHPAAAVVPAALAAAEANGARGDILVKAVVAGYETMHRIGLGMGTEPAGRGFHTTSLTAPTAAAMAASIVMDLPLDQLRSAVGLSASAAGGIKNFAAGNGGGMVKRLHLGRAAGEGVRSSRLAAAGFMGPPGAIDGKFGLLPVYGGSGANPARLVADLGSTWAINQVWFKGYPICGWIHSVMQVLLDLRGDGPLDPEDVEQVIVGVSSYAARNNGEKAPTDTMGAQYSIPFCSAVALLGDPRDPDSFRTEAVADPRTRALAQRVDLVVDPDVEAVYPAKFGARVSLRLRNGTERQGMVMECHGTPADPCSADELRDKFLLLACKRISVSRAEEIADLVENLENLESVTDLALLLAAD
ncbi:MmgE/PrpD family protein [Hoeflea sp. BAL378]|uniref:MmgE/PrpD family protein n=1 Tax=Hoeflea sp. BAL378 TaxID=1547437 RepID=UPI00068C3099|nr:MmgE/PrpD family protein [Hoeflea sp. BAL378]